jgi:uncharacterized membrane protein
MRESSAGSWSGAARWGCPCSLVDCLFVSNPAPVFSSAADHARRERRVALLMLAIGIPAALVAGFFGEWDYAPVVGWSAAALTFCVITWANIRNRDAAQTAAMAARDDPSPSAGDLLILLANVASLVAVAYLLVQANSAHGARQALLAGLAVVSVAISWALIHILFMLRYAVLYYSSPVGGIDFNQEDPPRFADFAYLAFTLGMTYQVSDTNLQNTRIRAAALRHGLLSFVFGTMILATMVNLVAGLPR